MSLADTKALDGSEICSTSESISALGEENSSARQLPKGTVIFSRTATVGKATILGRQMATSQDFANYVCGPHLHNRYLMQLFRHMQPEWNRLKAGSTHNTVYMPVFENLQVLLPPLHEQRKIAAILSSVDDAIEKTHAVIDQIQIVKRAMMQELLTRGMPGRHTRFKKTEIGEVPEGWRTLTLGDITTDSAFGPRFPGTLYDPRGNYGTLRTTDITDDWEIDYSTVPRARLPEEQFDAHRLLDRDLLVTRSGTCGVVCVFKEQSLPVLPGAFLIRFRLAPDAVPEFIRLAMMTSAVAARVQSMAAGGVQKNISGTNLRTLTLAVPGVVEQQEIVAAVDSVRDAMSRHRAELRQLNGLKTTLMSALLTGQLRVPLDDAAEAVA